MSNEEPKGRLSLRTIAMPANTNANGDIFGGWLVSQMDLGAQIAAQRRAKSRVVTVSIDKLVFKTPVEVGDTICCYADITKVGRTSITLNVQVWAINLNLEQRHKVTEGVFTFVAIDSNGKPHPVNRP